MGEEEGDREVDGVWVADREVLGVSLADRLVLGVRLLEGDRDGLADGTM